MAQHAWATVQAQRAWRPHIKRCRYCLMEYRRPGSKFNRYQSFVRDGFAQRWRKLEGSIGPCTKERV